VVAAAPAQHGADGGHKGMRAGVCLLQAMCWPQQEGFIIVAAAAAASALAMLLSMLGYACFPCLSSQRFDESWWFAWPF
jgi:hypothetical protein